METEIFESIFSSGRLQMMKLLLPHLPADKRGNFAIWIRLQEFLYTLRFVKEGHVIEMPPPLEGDDLLNSMLPYCDDRQRDQLQKLKQTLHQMDQMKEAMEMMQLMQELFPEGRNAENLDLSEMMNLFSSQGYNPSHKENENNGNLDDE